MFGLDTGKAEMPGAAALLAGAGAGEEASILPVELNQLSAQAQALEALAAQLAANDPQGEHGAEIADAKRAARDIQGTIEHVKREIAQAPLDRTGKRRLSAGWWAALSQYVQRTEQATERALHHAEECVQHEYASTFAAPHGKREPTKHVAVLPPRPPAVAPKTLATAPALAVVRHPPATPAPALGARAHVPASDASRPTLVTKLQAATHHAVEEAQSLGHRAMARVEAVASRTVEALQQPVHAVQAAAASVAAGVESHVVAPIEARWHAAVETVTQAQHRAAEAIAHRYQSLAEGVAHGIQRAHAGLQHQRVRLVGLLMATLSAGGGAAIERVESAEIVAVSREVPRHNPLAHMQLSPPDKAPVSPRMHQALEQVRALGQTVATLPNEAAAMPPRMAVLAKLISRLP